MPWLAAKPLLLASKSYARQTLLRSCGIVFEASAIEFDERGFEKTHPALKPAALAGALAQAKADVARITHPDRMILAADQILLFEDQVLHQCPTRAKARAQLQKLSGKSHHLISAAVLLDEKNNFHAWQETATLHMRPLSVDEIDAYLDREGPAVLNSVGCYFYESHGAQLFERFTGSRPAIMGLPLDGIKQFLIEQGYLKP